MQAPLPPIHLAEVGSTNDWVRAHGPALLDGQWVVADRQTAGRGRQGRAWEAPPGNFAGSALVRPWPAEAPIHLFSFVAALALHDAVVAHAPQAPASLKWPNDLLVGRAKLSGILLESWTDAGAIIIGIGVNLVHAPSVPGRATTALSAHTATVPTPLAFAHTLGAALHSRRAQWRAHGFAAVRADWLRRAHPHGTMLGTSIDGQLLEGRFAGLADDGALLLDSAAGLRTVHAGDIFAVPR